MMRFFVTFLLMFLSGLFWWLMKPAEPLKLPPFDPKTQIRIEFPVFGGGLSQSISPILHEDARMSTGLGDLSYEITNNVLNFKGRHYLLKTGDILRFEKLDAISINAEKVISIEDLMSLAAISQMGVWP